MQNILLYQPAGDIHSINECRYSLLKILSVYNLKPPADIKIVVYTDQPAMFEAYTTFFEDFEIRDSSLTNRFELALEQSKKGNVIYCTTECYLNEPIKNVFENIENGVVYVYKPIEINAEHITQLQHLKEFFSNNIITINNQSVDYPSNIKFYDTQLIGISQQSAGLLNNIIELTKKLLIKFTFDVAEQFAFAYYLSNQQVQFLNNRFKDFNNLPEFEELLQIFFKKNEEESVPNLVKLIHHLDVETIHNDKVKYEQLPFYKKWFNVILGKEWSIKKYQNKI